jgi:hypothetical protein
MGIHAKGWISKKISEHLNALGVNSWTGIQFYPELVFGIIRKALIKKVRVSNMTQLEGLEVSTSRASL